MADQTITQLTAGTPAANDVIPFVDLNTNTTKKATKTDLMGASGYSGYSGTGSSGYSGYSGQSGYSGYSGFSGQSGYSGYSGSGVSGYSGYSGAATSGYSGYSGNSTSGYSGYSGNSTSGYSGYSGLSGYSGYSGLSGYSGYSGSGVSGYSGYSGNSGYSGYSGATGASSGMSVLAARVYNSAAQSISNATDTALSFDTENYDTDTIHDNSTNPSRLTCTTGGKYIIEGMATFAANATGVRTISIKLNGTTVLATQTIPSLSTGTVPISIHTVYSLVATDYVELIVNQTSLGSLNANNGEGVTWFAMTRQADTGLSGYSGYSGYSGISGYSGYSGLSGYSGYSGKSGYSGYSGISGFSGYSGYSGDSAANSGYSGYSGKSGYSGYSGFSGYSGYSGAGLSGYSGYSGSGGSSTTAVTLVPTPLFWSAAAQSYVNGQLSGANTVLQLGQVHVPFQITANKITFALQTAGTTEVAYLGMWTEDGQTRLFSVTTPAMAASPVTTTLSSVVITPGIYYIGYILSAGSVDARSYNTSATGASDLRAVTSEPITEGTYTVTANTIPSTVTIASITAAASKTLLFRLDN